METICNVIHAHKNYWDCFKYSILLNEKSPEIHYKFFELEKPEIYQTRNMYPKIDTTSFDIILHDIITGNGSRLNNNNNILKYTQFQFSQRN